MVKVKFRKTKIELEKLKEVWNSTDGVQTLVWADGFDIETSFNYLIWNDTQGNQYVEVQTK